MQQGVWGSLQLRPLAAFKGLLLGVRRKGRAGEEKGQKGRTGEKRGGKGKERDERSPGSSDSPPPGCRGVRIVSGCQCSECCRTADAKQLFDSTV